MLILFLGFLLLFIILPISAYNGLVRKRNQVETSFSTIDVMLKKRHDLIPNLVAAVKQYMQHERELLTEITALREQAMSANKRKDQLAAEGQLDKALGKLSVSLENYPDLKADKNMMHLQASLNEVEEQISASRRSYNASVNTFNTAIQSFPTNILASLFGFKAFTLFEATTSERANVNVANLFNS